ncbi:MAG TPA: 1-deoxy-D-xylulose-5-phosphate reductoisomerase [Candidatus Hydrogenedentes bacterium]|jgi:1-deoxy-D-xylulose-5-phosphate reductoisomerase|nr:MAG: 1-deoxy-D-xylulose 5-phosphate reductoisomerase [Candidatus Hydrogenedentes bacterium ADurb.Bin101]HOC68226.1 1-deoxy-D-xylulose-5-phosphate reductoisomerase [Candidatus Hydrogenedentota bacterium]HQN01695.1 1-deoxy-D-xylulose-5-phosphate reductoisomerase [Candidatus Hydrogenedentota bacterium]
MVKRISILGSTGSIGRNTLDVIRRNPQAFKVEALAARGNAGLLREQILEFRPALAALHHVEAAEALRDSNPGCAIFSGIEGLKEVAAHPADLVVNALVGAVGLNPLLAAINAGNHVAIANKEPLVMAGRYILEKARRAGISVLPIDSEHSAIFQCMQGNRREDVRCVHLTASGGPFYDKSPEELHHITPEQAMRHPTWDMGNKISVDSATLMNKGLEIIEAMWLFGLRSDQIQVVIHPQSIVHSMVEFNDGSLIAQLGRTDMRLPIAYALGFPERLPAPCDMRLDVTSLTKLSFSTPNDSAFPCLRLARRAAQAGGTAPAVLNGANEIAVELFCAGKIAFNTIAEIVDQTLERCDISSEYRLDAILEADRTARECARAIARTME